MDGEDYNLWDKNSTTVIEEIYNFLKILLDGLGIYANGLTGYIKSVGSSYQRFLNNAA